MFVFFSFWNRTVFFLGKPQLLQRFKMIESIFWLDEEVLHTTWDTDISVRMGHEEFRQLQSAMLYKQTQ